MNLIGGKVKHVKFGEGVIVGVKERCVSVDFNGVIKDFLIETIETFFSFEDENVRNAANIVTKIVAKVRVWIIYADFEGIFLPLTLGKIDLALTARAEQIKYPEILASRRYDLILFQLHKTSCILKILFV